MQVERRVEASALRHCVVWADSCPPHLRLGIEHAVMVAQDDAPRHVQLGVRGGKGAAPARFKRGVATRPVGMAARIRSELCRCKEPPSEHSPNGGHATRIEVVSKRQNEVRGAFCTHPRGHVCRKVSSCCGVMRPPVSDGEKTAEVPTRRATPA